MSGSDWMITTTTAAISAALISLPIMFPPPHGFYGLKLVRSEVQKPALVSPQVRSWIVVRDHRHVHLAVDVAQHGLDQRCAPSQEQVLRVGPSQFPGRAQARPGPQDDPAAARDADAVDEHVIGLG